MRRLLLPSIGMLLIGFIATASSASPPKLTCTVTAVYREPDNSIARVYEGALLFFDPTTGTLVGEFDSGKTVPESVSPSSPRVRNQVRDDFVLAYEAPSGNFTAVAVPQPLVGPTQPNLAWFSYMEEDASFRLFTAWIQAVVVGKCTRSR